VKLEKKRWGSMKNGMRGISLKEEKESEGETEIEMLWEWERGRACLLLEIARGAPPSLKDSN
jgi:hypothetical protein